ncbi:sugar transferase [Marinobacterium sp. xm-d-564]|uniref:sugar transferase n=1 Tax=Marinobacterium sp. xm-d-564 TaxID=2497742 RepID=UPI00156A3EFD|nr:sugar transferase [Marinobacterium sp. xm-d-564]NRP59894.1 UDP-glucose:undecaprenyl-phosphate glucose-1-phosphate transferase [Marinobacterium sp. xm-d-564]
MYLRTFENTTLLKVISEASLALLALSPQLIWAAYKVKRSSPGPILFKQDRHGWDGKIIKVWKFRSMKLHTEEKGTITQAKANDDRVTSFGKFIRRTSIDELPQLFNVIQGTLSLVGPRPHAVEHNDYYVEKIKAYFARHRIKPGITGLAQISGSRGETETVEKMQQRLEYDLSYINNWSLLTDIKILIKTPLTLFGKNIY